MSSRSYCFTSFEEKVMYDKDVIRYMVVGKEMCPSTNRYHLQGYAELFQKLTLKRFQKTIEDKKAHCEFRKGTREEARNYCMKDGNYTEYGTWESGGQGCRADLKEMIKECSTIEKVMDEYPEKYCQYKSGLEKIYARKLELSIPDWRTVFVSAIWGKSGCGKTRKAVEENPDYYMLNTNSNGAIWFDGYTGQKCLIIDDFYGWIKWGDLLKILDGYKYRCQVKGGHTWAQWTKVILTSNKDPKYWYANIFDQAALVRRINESVYIGSDPIVCESASTGALSNEFVFND